MAGAGDGAIRDLHLEGITGVPHLKFEHEDCLELMDAEADPHGTFIRCIKNEGHVQWIMATQFETQRLPFQYQDEDITQTIKALSDRTVLVLAKQISNERPDTFPETPQGRFYPHYKDKIGKPYPFARNKRMCSRRWGSGWVTFCQVMKDAPCTCQKCAKLPQEDRCLNWGKVFVKTAKHVVFDTAEAKCTEIELFYDTEEARKKGWTQKFEGQKMVYSSLEGDWCEIECITHDVELSYQLIKICRFSNCLQEKVNEKYANTEVPMVVCISHPHGFVKMITLGVRSKTYNVVAVKAEGMAFTLVKYDASTCPGSSGAPVWCLGRSRWIGGIHTHSLSVRRGESMSGASWDIMSPSDLQSPVTTGTGHDIPSSQKSKLHLQFDHCRKDPNHMSYVPVEKVLLQDLPPDYQQDCIIEFIQLLSKTIVYLRIACTSPERPHVFPGSSQPFPYSQLWGVDIMRHGTGFISCVSRYRAVNCICRECKYANVFYQDWGKIHIKTAAHVVFDSSEVQETIANLFYTRDTSEVLTLFGCSVVEIDAREDQSEIVFVTHDTQLCKKLERILQDRFAVLEKVHENLKSRLVETSLYVSFCHPHGCCQHIVVSREPCLAVDLYSSKGYSSKLTVQTFSPTLCPGSMGGPIWAVCNAWVNLPSDLKSSLPQESGAGFRANLEQAAGKSFETDFLIIGKTGHGKSATGNSILGRYEFDESPGGESLTFGVCEAWTEIGDVTVKVIDGPGIGDTRLNSLEEVKKAYLNMSEAMLRCSRGFHALLIVLKFGMRFTAEERKTVDMLKMLLGSNVIQDYGICVITHGDVFELHKRRAKSTKTFIQWCEEEHGELGDLFRECEYRCVLFENLTEDPEVKSRQVQELLELVSTLKGRRYTNAIFAEAEKEREKLIVQRKAPLLSEDIMKRLSLMLKALTDLQEFKEESDCISKLNYLEDKAGGLLWDIRKEDKATGELKGLEDSIICVQKIINQCKKSWEQRTEKIDTEVKYRKMMLTLEEEREKLQQATKERSESRCSIS